MNGRPIDPDPAWTPPDGSWASSAGNRRSMKSNRGRDTGPERAIRSLVHAAGLRYRVSARPLPDVRRTADLVFRPTKVAVFVDGCFWHRCPEHFTMPKANHEYWEPKIRRNVERDRETDALLGEAGWLVLRFWEHEAPEDCAHLICEAVTARKKPD
ncbi:very short patch repair endonuclease [Tomitella fengzijianii]|uniref:DNA mismatch endonuclease Vsr n=1 Tax=Tomitella fengzijianii TaxID=2597660 RepID=A0A516WZR0_9ACTN|nr:very short patch repair endonuclease [Tomitella fengzijianii]QDQ96339.1 DNA mismatch endonuclease Vsr [Tomitella fengzijianii]